MDDLLQTRAQKDGLQFSLAQILQKIKLFSYDNNKSSLKNKPHLLLKVGAKRRQLARTLPKEMETGKLQNRRLVSTLFPYLSTRPRIIIFVSL